MPDMVEQANPPRVVVIGAGPAGIVAAASFAQRGFKVEVHEKRPGPPDPAVDVQHSFTIVLNPKGLNGIRSMGAPVDDCKRFPLHACVRHTADGRYHQAFLEPQPGVVHAFERSELALWLYNTVRELYPDAVKFVFNSACLGLDLERKEVLVGPTPASKKTTSAEIDKSPSRLLLEEVAAADVSSSATSAQAGVSTTAVGYDLLVAADGANSAVRSHLCRLLPDHFVSTRREAPLVYKRFRQLPVAGDITGKYGPDGAVLHFFGAKLPSSSTTTGSTHKASAAAGGGKSKEVAAGHQKDISGDEPGDDSSNVPHFEIDSKDDAASGVAIRGHGPTGWGFLSLINKEDGSMSGGLSISIHDQHRLKAVEDYEATLANVPLPHATLRAMCEQLEAAPWSWAGCWVRCSRLHGPHVLLIGDAAHAVSPSMGQGCNAALEDVTVLQQIMDELLSSGAAAGQLLELLQQLPEEFTGRRLPDVHALVWLDENARAFRGQLGVFNRHFAMYCAHMYCRAALHHVAPRLVSKPLLQQVWESPVPYTEIAKQMRRDGATLMALAGLLGVGACLAGAVLMAGRSRA